MTPVETTISEVSQAITEVARFKHSTGFTLWMTGLSGAGKSTLSEVLKSKLRDEYGRNVEILDGDEVRKGLSRDLGLSKEDREEHARRVSYVAKLLSRNEVICIVALISPYKSSRASAKEVIGKESFVEVYVKASLSVCEGRDPKGLYAKARKGEITNMTGLSDPYEAPTEPDVVVETENSTPQDCANLLINYLCENKFLVEKGKIEFNGSSSLPLIDSGHLTRKPLQ